MTVLRGTWSHTWTEENEAPSSVCGGGGGGEGGGREKSNVVVVGWVGAFCLQC